MPNKFLDRNWWKDLAVAIIATTVSIILTFGTASLVNRREQKKERKLTALMVISSIESFARNLDDQAEFWKRKDSIATWLLALPLDEVAEFGDEPIRDAIAEVFVVPVLRHDQTAETIFSSNINTWKNMRNFQFVDNVGECFSNMSWIENRLNEDAVAFDDRAAQINNNPSDYPGSCVSEKILRDEQVRTQLRLPESVKEWLMYCSEFMRYLNRKNMRLIGISEEDVLAFTNARTVVDEEDGDEPDYIRQNSPSLDRDSVAVKLDYAQRLDSLKNQNR